MKASVYSIEVYYLNDKKACVKRKEVDYDSYAEADAIYQATIKKLTNALVVMRLKEESGETMLTTYMTKQGNV